MMLTGPLRYLIGGDDSYGGEGGCVTEFSYDAEAPTKVGWSVKYGNLFFEKWEDSDEKTRALYGPYLHTSDTAQEYHEGQIDPNGPGWERNLTEQIERATRSGFQYIEWDNPDSYHLDQVLDAVDRAWHASLYVIAKNPLLIEGNRSSYLSHPAIVGCVVEQGAGTCNAMDALRRAAFKPLLPVWFVCFGGIEARRWANQRARVITANNYVNMGVTMSTDGEYKNSVDILKPTIVVTQ